MKRFPIGFPRTGSTIPPAPPGEPVRPRILLFIAIVSFFIALLALGLLFNQPDILEIEQKNEINTDPYLEKLDKGIRLLEVYEINLRKLQELYEHNYPLALQEEREGKNVSTVVSRQE